MEILMANEAHIPGILTLLRQVCEVHHRIRPDIFQSSALKYTPEQLTAILADETRPIFVAEEEGSVVGYCFCQLRSYDGTGVSTCRKELYIDDLCVDEGRRGQHVGTVLFDHAVGFAKTNRCQFLTLNVWCGNEGALKFYEHAGLTPRNMTMETKLC
ncbi:MAG: GNAT family N-acetyltransferase [Faecousia sp.]